MSVDTTSRGAVSGETLYSFAAALRAQGHGPATVEKYRREAAAFAAWLGGAALTAECAAAYRDRLTARRTASGVNGAVSALNRLFAYLGRPDCRLRGLPVQRKLCRDEGRELTAGEYRRLLSAARRKKRERLLLAMEAICATGIRVSELRFFTLEAARAGKAVVTNKGKTREVYLPGKLCKRLREYAKAHGVLSGPVLVTSGGRPLDRSNLWREMKSLCREARVAAGKVFPHNLRHLFARTFYKAERDLARLADILGHASVDTTRIYTLETGSAWRRRLEKLDLLL